MGVRRNDDVLVEVKAFDMLRCCPRRRYVWDGRVRIRNARAWRAVRGGYTEKGFIFVACFLVGSTLIAAPTEWEEKI